MEHYLNNKQLAELMAVFDAQYIAAVTNQAVETTWSSDETMQYIISMEKAYMECGRLYGRNNTLFAFLERYAPFMEDFIPAETKAALDLMDGASKSYQTIICKDNCPFTDYGERVYDTQMQQMRKSAPDWYVMEKCNAGLINIEDYHQASDHIVDEQCRAVHAIEGLKNWHEEFAFTQDTGHIYQKIKRKVRIALKIQRYIEMEFDVTEEQFQELKDGENPFYEEMSSEAVAYGDSSTAYKVFDTDGSVIVPWVKKGEVLDAK